ncbi:MAG: hypothetical protein QOH72_255 [Solirubrobacteraceae bacterium]|jgi:hypothetical protein|nr:hypothetical protein [Solirubrobacteraceae bacterium]
MAVLGGDRDGQPPPDSRREYDDLRRDLIGVERDTLHDLRDSGRLRQETMRRVERDLDLEEARLRT